MNLVIILTLTACFETAKQEEVKKEDSKKEQKSKNGFYIEQDNQTFTGTNITIKKAAFRIASETEGFSIVIAKKPIYNLADHKEIVKLTGTEGAWYLGQLPFYQRSDLLSDRNACLAYYGNEGKGCQEYVQEKQRLGFKLHYAYTFAEYHVLKKSVTLLGLGREKIESLPFGTYYLYLFRSEHPMGKVAHSKRVTRMTLNLQ